jgi:hypothetical protein
VSTFADPEVIRMAKEDFIAVAGDDWYQRRRQDAEGEFFRKVADQGPRQGEGGGTRQGIYMFTADGKLLGFRNHQDASVMRNELKQALAIFNNIPLAQVAPGAIKVGDLPKVDPDFHRTPPKGGLIVNVYTRILDKDAKGEFCHGTCDFTGGDRAATDHLWMTEADWKGLVPPTLKKGDVMPLSPRLAMRMLRFHFVDNTRGEPSHWSHEEVRSQNLTLTVTEVTAKEARIRLEGSVLLTTHPDANKANRGYDASLLAFVHYDKVQQKITRFDGVAFGMHWGVGTYTPGARLGKTPLGIAFELSSGESPLDQVPPAGARHLPGYIQADSK